MKKGVLFLLSALTFTSISASTVLTSCAASVGNATFTLDYQKDFVKVEVQKPSKTYNAGDVLNVKYTLTEGYDLAYVTLNDAKVENVNAIKLEVGQNMIRVYVKQTSAVSGSTNLRDFDFALSQDGKSLSIYGYNPSGVMPSVLEIPSKYNGLPVTSISYLVNPSNGNVLSHFVFGGLKKIKFPASITSIDTRCFLNNTTLNEYIVDAENPVYKAVDCNLYSKDGTKLIAFAHGSTKEFTLPEAVTEIGEHALFGAMKLEKINFNTKIKKIGAYSFYGCTGLTEIIIPDSVTTIGTAAFQSCNGLKLIKLSNSLQVIEESTFRQCNALTEINIPGSVKNVKAYAFFDNKLLTNVTFNEGLVTLEDNSFSYVGIKEAHFPASLREIGKTAFIQCSNLTKITFKEGIEKIGDSAFYATMLKEVTLPASLVELGRDAFFQCLALEQFNVSPNSTIVTSVDGVLYSKDLKTLISYPNAKKIKEYKVVDGTERLGFRCFAFLSVNPFEPSNDPYSLVSLTLPKSIKAMENPFYGANLIELKYEGTKAEFALIDTTCTFNGEQYDWDTGANNSLSERIIYLGEKA